MRYLSARKDDTLPGRVRMDIALQRNALCIEALTPTTTEPDLDPPVGFAFVASANLPTTKSASCREHDST